MAYMCVLAPSCECDGCEECKEYNEPEYYNKQLRDEYEADYKREEDYIRFLEREDRNGNI